MRLNYGPRSAIRLYPTRSRHSHKSAGWFRAQWLDLGHALQNAHGLPISGKRLALPHRRSKNSIYMNVLHDLFNLVGKEHYDYNHTSGLLKVFGSDWMVMGAKDEGSEKFLRGSTIGVAICDEVVLMPKGFFQMLLTRLSPQGARLYGTTNPDSPKHWLKEEYIDDQVLERKGLIRVMNVTMEDNPEPHAGIRGESEVALQRCVL